MSSVRFIIVPKRQEPRHLFSDVVSVSLTVSIFPQLVPQSAPMNPNLHTLEPPADALPTCFTDGADLCQDPQNEAKQMRAHQGLAVEVMQALLHLN